MNDMRSVAGAPAVSSGSGESGIGAARRAASRWLAIALLALLVAPPATGQSGGAAGTLSLGLASSASGGAGLAPREAADTLGLVSEFDVNGLKVLVKRREGSQTVVAGLFLRGGVRNLTAETAGIEALMLAVATEASENFPRERFRRELSSMGTEVDFGVGYDYSQLTLNSTLLHFDRSWELFMDAAVRPSFSPEDFQRVQNRMLARLSNSQDSPDSYLQELQSRVAYAGHPYTNDPQGTVESIRRLSVDDVRRYHQQAMQTSRLLLVVVGDLDPADVRQKVTATFGRLPQGDYRPDPVPPLAFNAPSLAITQRNLLTNYVQGVFAAPPLLSPDFYAMRVASSILQSRVYSEVRVRRNLSYAPDAFLWNQAANAGGIYVTADDANQAVSVMLNEIERLQREPVSGRELTATAQHFLTIHYLAQETNAAQAAELARYELIGGGWREADAFLERLRAVSSDDVQRVANTYMRNLQFVVLGDPRSIDRDAFTRQVGL